MSIKQTIFTSYSNQEPVQGSRRSVHVISQAPDSSDIVTLNPLHTRGASLKIVHEEIGSSEDHPYVTVEPEPFDNDVQPPVTTGQNQYDNVAQPPVPIKQELYDNDVQLPATIEPEPYENDVQPPETSKPEPIQQ